MLQNFVLEPDVDLENQYYNSKSLKETGPQVGLYFFKGGYGEDHSYFYSYTQTRSVEDDLIDDTSTNKILPLMSNKSKKIRKFCFIFPLKYLLITLYLILIELYLINHHARLMVGCWSVIIS